MKIGVISLGCCKNLVDTENLLGVLKQSNQEIVTSYDEAEAIIINTCGFIVPAKEEAINTILQMSEYKSKNLKKLIVMGCLAQRYKEDLEKEMPEVDCFISIDEYGHLGEILSRVLDTKIVNTYGKSQRVLSGKPWMAYLKIADGCDNKCTYCAIPLIRGPYISFPMEDLIAEAKRLADSGVKELNLIAQDTTRYGIDLYGSRKLLDLLVELNKIEKLHWIRILYMYPDEIDDALILGMKKLNKVIPYFDIPIQHGSDRMLEAMNRRGTAQTIRDIVNKIRLNFEDPILRTTLIVGYPTETMDDVYDNMKLMEEIRWNHLGAFTYSKEEDTPSYEIEDDVSEDEKANRLNSIMDLQEKLVAIENESFISKKYEVLVESQNPLTHLYSGRSVHFAPDGIDGEVIFGCPHELKPGDFVWVEIKRVKKHNLIGDYVELH